MRSTVRRLGSALALFGVRPGQGLRAAVALPKFRRHYREFRQQLERSGAPFAVGKLYPCLGEDSDAAGGASGHYFHQDLLVARRIYESNPKRHIDIGSRVDGFVAHVACFRPIDVLDIRPLKTNARNIRFLQADLMKPPPADLVEATDSLSCLHAIEHFGLGRYGDQIDIDGHVKAIGHMASMVAPGGQFYISAPIGPQRVEFNAHRVFSVQYLLECLEPHFKLDRFSYVDDAGDIHENVDLSPDLATDNFGTNFGCGIFELRKKGALN